MLSHIWVFKYIYVGRLQSSFVRAGVQDLAQVNRYYLGVWLFCTSLSRLPTNQQTRGSRLVSSSSSGYPGSGSLGQQTQQGRAVQTLPSAPLEESTGVPGKGSPQDTPEESPFNGAFPSPGRHPGRILTRCPNHLNWLFSMWRSSSSTVSSQTRGLVVQSLVHATCRSL